MLRTPGPPESSFTDDPLRILRAARFTAQLGFTAAPEVAAAMTELAGLLAPPKVSAERIEGELTKLLLSPLPGGPAAGIRLLVETGVADQVLPEIPQLRLETDEHSPAQGRVRALADRAEPGDRPGVPVRPGA